MCTDVGAAQAELPTINALELTFGVKYKYHSRTHVQTLAAQMHIQQQLRLS